MRMEKRRDGFKCRTCGQSFARYQALGGHRTGHTRPKERERTKDKVLRVHECLVCGLNFSTGQALGGHMRRHKDLELSAAPVFVRVLNFDLNLTPIDDDDDEKEEAGLPEIALKLGLGTE